MQACKYFCIFPYLQWCGLLFVIFLVEVQSSFETSWNNLGTANFYWNWYGILAVQALGINQHLWHQSFLFCGWTSPSKRQYQIDRWDDSSQVWCYCGLTHKYLLHFLEWDVSFLNYCHLCKYYPKSFETNLMYSKEPYGCTHVQT